MIRAIPVIKKKKDLSLQLFLKTRKPHLLELDQNHNFLKKLVEVLECTFCFIAWDANIYMAGNTPLNLADFVTNFEFNQRDTVGQRS